MSEPDIAFLLTGQVRHDLVSRQPDGAAGASRKASTSGSPNGSHTSALIAPSFCDDAVVAEDPC